MRQVSVGRAVRGRDGSAVQLQRVGRDADPVVITIVLLHDVAEVRVLPPRSGVDRVPRLRPDGQRHPGGAGHRHCPVELDFHLDRLPPCVGVTPSQVIERDVSHARWRDQAAVHLAAAVGGDRRVCQVGGRRTVGGGDGSTAQHQRVGRDTDTVLIAVPLLHGVAEVQRIAAPSGRGRVPRLRSDGQRNSGLARCLHPAVERDDHLNRLSQFVGVTPRWGGIEVDSRHPRWSNVAAAVNFPVAFRAYRRVRQVSVGRAVRGRDRSAVEDQRVRRDADPVLITVPLLHHVAEVHVAVVSPPRGEGRVPRLGPDGQLNLGPSGHFHYFVEMDSHPNGFPSFIGVTPRGGVAEVEVCHSRRRCQAAVHLAVAVGGYRPVREICGGRSVGSRDGSAGEGQRVGGNADPVLVTIPRLHGVVEVQGLGPPASKSCVPRLRPDGQRHLRIAGCRHRSVELDFHFNRLAQLVRVTPRWWGVAEADSPHLRWRDIAAVHLACPLGGHRLVREICGSRAVGGRDGSADEGQGVGRDADAVLITVPRLHGVLEA